MTSPSGAHISGNPEIPYDEDNSVQLIIPEHNDI